MSPKPRSALSPLHRAPSSPVTRAASSPGTRQGSSPGPRQGISPGPRATSSPVPRTTTSPVARAGMSPVLPTTISPKARASASSEPRRSRDRGSAQARRSYGSISSVSGKNTTPDPLESIPDSDSSGSSDGVTKKYFRGESPVDVVSSPSSSSPEPSSGKLSDAG